MSEIIDKSFYDVNVFELSRRLLGCLIVRNENEEKIYARIVEVEIYPGGDDRASHSYNGHRSKRNESMYLPSGTLYVYRIYGSYNCMNISSKEEGAAVLVRSIYCLNEVDESKKLGRGPGKLCAYLNITNIDHDKINLLKSTQIFLAKDKIYEAIQSDMKFVCIRSMVKTVTNNSIKISVSEDVGLTDDKDENDDDISNDDNDDGILNDEKDERNWLPIEWKKNIKYVEMNLSNRRATGSKRKLIYNSSGKTRKDSEGRSIEKEFTSIVIISNRININGTGEEAMRKPFRFYLKTYLSSVSNNSKTMNEFIKNYCY
ncbi:hypothetical protein SNEBB_010462 [Seison nebaliae]|nr:hypothetical protein SNEBB_010462 [Seison nebaliae]